ncbi:MAG: hypothetical protein ACI9V1_001765 [Spirosomataceae bacterium]|jgi:hypothetical protein
MKIILNLTLLFFIMSPELHAQDDMMTRMLLDDYKEGTYHIVYDGETAYLSRDWKLGRVYFKDNTVRDLVINYNAYNQRLERLEKGQKLTVENPLTHFILSDTSTASGGFLFRNGFRPYERQDEQTFYQVLHNSGNFKLLKHAYYNGREERKFNEATTNFKFNLYENYYIAYSTRQLQRIKKSKKQVLALFPKYEEQVTTFISNEKLKFKEWSDVGKVLSYVETLF